MTLAYLILNIIVAGSVFGPCSRYSQADSNCKSCDGLTGLTITNVLPAHLLCFRNRVHMASSPIATLATFQLQTCKFCGPGIESQPCTLTTCFRQRGSMHGKELAGNVSFTPLPDGLHLKERLGWGYVVFTQVSLTLQE